MSLERVKKKRCGSNSWIGKAEGEAASIDEEGRCGRELKKYRGNVEAVGSEEKRREERKLDREGGGYGREEN